MVIEKLIPDLHEKVMTFLDAKSRNHALVVNKIRAKGKKVPRNALAYFLERSKAQEKRTRQMAKTIPNVKRATEEYQDLVNEIDAYLEHFFQTREIFLRWFKTEVEKLLHSMSAYAGAVKSIDLTTTLVSGIEEAEACLDAMEESHVIVMNSFTYYFARWVDFMGVDTTELREKFRKALETEE